MEQPENRGTELYTSARRRGVWLACGLLAAGLLATALAVRLVKADADAEAKVEFDFTSNEIRGHILSRFRAHEQILLGAAAFYEGMGGVTRPQWRRYVERQELGSRLAGILGLGFARLIPRRQLARHILAIRAEGFPAYQVRPAGERAQYSAVVYLEPFKGRNLRAFGYDMLSEPVRREAMERARDRNAPALSGKVTLVQETGHEVQAGTLMYMPVYRKGMPIATVAQRRAAIEGWVYSPYRMADLLRGILGGWDLSSESRIRLQVYDGARAAPETLLYDSHPAGDREKGNVALSRITAAGREWTLRFSTVGGRAAAADYGKVWLTGFGGTGISLLLAWLLLNLHYTRVKEQQLRHSKEEFSILFDSIGDAVLIHDESGQIRAANLTASAELGYSPAELCALTVDRLNPQENAALTQERLARLIAQGRHSFETEHRRKDGSYMPVEVNARKFSWKGRPAVVSICRDITGRRQAAAEKSRLEEQFRQSQKMETIGLLAGGIAHDFNNILTAIKGYGFLVSESFRPEDPGLADMGEIMKAADRATTLTRQLLAFSRKQIMVPKVVDLNKVLGDMQNMLRRIIGEDIKLSTELFSAPCLAKVDPGLIEQVVMNLVLNARDAVSKNGEIALVTEIMTPSGEFSSAHPDLVPGRLVCVKVRDNGCGMSPEVMKHLFEPFYTTKEKSKGTGLGLSMAFGTVKQSGGEIEAESQPGTGSTFKLYFPLAKAAVQETPVGKTGEGSKGGTETVLIVEDEEQLRRLGERLLKGLGYRVLTAVDGKDAINVIERHGKPVDLLLTDVVMPGMSGRELALELARRKLAPRTLYMSGYTDEAIVKHGVLEPGIAFIYKPFTVEALTAKLREVLDGPADQAKA